MFARSNRTRCGDGVRLAVKPGRPSSFDLQVRLTKPPGAVRRQAYGDRLESKPIMVPTIKVLLISVVCISLLRATTCDAAIQDQAAQLLASTSGNSSSNADQDATAAPLSNSIDAAQLDSLQLQFADSERGRNPNESGATVPKLMGADAGLQLLVLGKRTNVASHQAEDVDVTRLVNWEIEPTSVAMIDDHGYLRPLQEGAAKVTATFGSLSVSTPVTVAGIANEASMNFPNQIVPIFTKHGCNGGGCHGKSGGQNGFALSLLGFEPSEDYEHLVKEAGGRRLFPALPQRSLLLTKAIGEVPHGGGQRFEKDSVEYRLIERWIAQGMPYGAPDDPVISKIEVLPKRQTIERNQSQQLRVVATYSDGATEDVTRMAQFEANDKTMAEIDPDGLVHSNDSTGSVAVMVRYQGLVDVFHATIPLGVAVAKLPSIVNEVDRLVFENLERIGLPPSELCTDSEYLRRVTLDLHGRLPSVEETEGFLSDARTDKRRRLVDTLLNDVRYADYFAGKWSSILRNRRVRNEDRLATFAFYNWIRESLSDNKPYDQFVREILVSSGEVGTNPTVAWYRQVNDQTQQVEDTAQLFLGMRIQCARCHHHPFETWSQQDYYGFAAFFSQVTRKRSEVNGEERIYAKYQAPQTRNPKTGQMVLPTGLGADTLQIAPHEDARLHLANWLAEPDNPFFAKAFVNRYWKHFFGRGLVDPEDDMRITNPACNPELLDRLAQDFVDSGFDMKSVIRTICVSSTYQLSSKPNEWNQDDRQNFSRFYPRRLNAEVLLDSVNELTATSTPFSGLPAGTAAVQLPDNGFQSYFLTVFGTPQGNTACECERSDAANLAQSLHLLNSDEVQQKLTSANARSHLLAADADREHSEKIRELYLRAFSRPPSVQELDIALSYIQQRQDRVAQAYEDIVWVMANTKEFMFNH